MLPGPARARASDRLGPPWTGRLRRPRGGSGIVQVQRDLDVQPAASLRERFRPRGQALAGVHQPGGHLVAPAGHVAQLVSLRSEDLDGERIVAVLGLPPRNPSSSRLSQLLAVPADTPASRARSSWLTTRLPRRPTAAPAPPNTASDEVSIVADPTPAPAPPVTARVARRCCRRPTPHAEARRAETPIPAPSDEL